eukprot:TRINITY_DN21741_c0_g1_i1.p1 TRINITY_DN21741_c0_g1~~TRINITY_DN21741_c0_g1_i1.p1  ORF type:complete len:161 (-),score=45.26 TRINITY_DN21741_c0_g1_i1:191-673(-)
MSEGRRQLKRGESQAILNEEQVEELKLAFDLFDESSSGSLEKSDLKNQMDKFGLKVSGSELDAMFKEGDVTGAGKIKFPEFMSMMARKMKQTDTEEELLEAFRVFDLHGEGFIAEKDLSDALLNTGDKLTKDELKEFLQSCSADGQVQYKTFVNTLYATK